MCYVTFGYVSVCFYPRRVYLGLILQRPRSRLIPHRKSLEGSFSIQKSWFRPHTPYILSRRPPTKRSKERRSLLVVFFRRWTSREQQVRSFFPSAENIQGNRERARTILIPQSWPAPLQKVTTTRTEGRKGETGTLEGERKKERVRVRSTNNWAKLLLANNYSNDWRHRILRVPLRPRSPLPPRTISLTKGQRNPRNKRKQKGRCTLRFAASDGLESDRNEFHRTLQSYERIYSTR